MESFSIFIVCAVEPWSLFLQKPARCLQCDVLRACDIFCGSKRFGLVPRRRSASKSKATQGSPSCGLFSKKKKKCKDKYLAKHSSSESLKPPVPPDPDPLTLRVPQSPSFLP